MSKSFSQSSISKTLRKNNSIYSESKANNSQKSSEVKRFQHPTNRLSKSLNDLPKNNQKPSSFQQEQELSKNCAGLLKQVSQKIEQLCELLIRLCEGVSPFLNFSLQHEVEQSRISSPDCFQQIKGIQKHSKQGKSVLQQMQKQFGQYKNIIEGNKHLKVLFNMNNAQVKADGYVIVNRQNSVSLTNSEDSDKLGQSDEQDQDRNWRRQFDEIIYEDDPGLARNKDFPFINSQKEKKQHDIFSITDPNSKDDKELEYLPNESQQGQEQQVNLNLGQLLQKIVSQK